MNLLDYGKHFISVFIKISGNFQAHLNAQQRACQKTKHIFRVIALMMLNRPGKQCFNTIKVVS